MAFRGKVALVTGAGSSMGQISARRLADAGATVAALDVNEKGLAETAEGRDTVHPYPCDVADLETVRSVVAAIEGDLGQIDRVTHAAAIMPAAAAVEMPAELTAKVMRINFEGTVNFASTVLPSMLERRSGDFIVFGSVAGECVTPHMGAYCASKAAVNIFTEVLIRENVGSGVRFCLVCPPMTNTPLVQQATVEGGAKSVMIGVEQGRGADPNDIVTAIEDGLERGKEFLYPDAEAKALHWARRLTPNLMWKIIRKVEDAA